MRASTRPIDSMTRVPICGRKVESTLLMLFHEYSFRKALHDVYFGKFKLVLIIGKSNKSYIRNTKGTLHKPKNII